MIDDRDSRARLRDDMEHCSPRNRPDTAEVSETDHPKRKTPLKSWGKDFDPGQIGCYPSGKQASGAPWARRKDTWPPGLGGP